MNRFVHIVDDNPLVRHAMCALLSDEGFESEAYASGYDFLSRAKLDHGIIVLDLKLGDVNGLEVLEQLAKRNCPLPVIVVSGHGNISAAVEAMKLGATDFVEKPYDDAKLVACLERALVNQKSSEEELIGQAEATAKVEALTPRQRQILEGIVAGQSNKMMGRRLGLSPRTVESHRSHMLDRLGVSNISDAIRLANQAGFGHSVPQEDRLAHPLPALDESLRADQLELQWSGVVADLASQARRRSG